MNKPDGIWNIVANRLHVELKEIAEELRARFQSLHFSFHSYSNDLFALSLIGDFADTSQVSLAEIEDWQTVTFTVNCMRSESNIKISCDINKGLWLIEIPDQIISLSADQDEVHKNILHAFSKIEEFLALNRDTIGDNLKN